MGKKRFNPGTAASMFFLNATNPQTIKLARKVMIDWGYKAQRLANRALKTARRARRPQRPPATTGKPPMREQVIHFVNKRMPGGLPKRTARALLDIEDRNYVPIIRDPQATTQRLGGGVLLSGLRLGAAVLPGRARHPGHAVARRACRPCCRRAICAAAIRSAAPASSRRREKIITDNRVLFHRVANTLNYLDIKTVVVSCGTCFDQLQGYEFDQIFPGCKILDIHEYLMEKGVRAQGRHRHALHVPRPLSFADEEARPAHSRQHAHERRTERAASRRTSDAAANPERSALTRPDVSTQVRFRKEQEVRAGVERDTRGGHRGEVKMLTSCPSCLQGLKRFNDDADLDADYIVVEIAKNLLGADWLADYVRRANSGGIERVLV